MSTIITEKFFDRIDFTAAMLAKGDYENCIFKNCNFYNTDLSNYKFRECKFDGCDFSLVKVHNT